MKCNQPGIQCDSCDSWLHVCCLEMNIDDYKTFATSSCTWVCPNCDVSNFATTLLDLSTNSLNSLNSFNLFSVDGTQPSGIPTNCPPLNRTATDASNRGISTPKHGKTSKRNTSRGMIINCNGLKGSAHSTEFQV